MLRWKKRDEGFEWQKYVRTTIKLRREARREKAFNLGQNVAEGAKAASAAADSMARSGLQRLGGAIRKTMLKGGQFAVAGMAMLGAGLGVAVRSLAGPMAPVLDLLGRPGVGGPLMMIGLIALLGGLIRVALLPAGLDGEAIAALVIGATCLGLGLGPALWLGHSGMPRRIAMPTVPLPSRPWLIGGGASLLVAAGATTMLVGPWKIGAMSLPGLPSLTLASAPSIAGRASVLEANILRIGGHTVRLTGIEVPDPDQRCHRAGAKRGNRGWPCGESSKEATARLVRGRDVTCMVGGKDEAGIASGSCAVGGADVAGALVRAGHAFAESGLLSSYKSAEAEAKAARAGLWASAEPERPAQYRQRLWAAAKEQAPEGCPIKGRVSGGERVYVLPWSSNYSRVRLNKRRGERWFCTQEEAEAAGWRSSRRG